MRIYNTAAKCFMTVLLLMAFNNVQAQRYTFYEGKSISAKSVSMDEETYVHINLQINDTLDTLVLNWRVLENEFTGDTWDLETFSFCDPFSCYYDPLPMSQTATIMPGIDTAQFKLGAKPKNSQANISSLKVVVNEVGKTEYDTLTFTLDPRSVGLPECFGSPVAESLSVYPNPATKTLTLDIDPAKNSSVQIYTVNGAKVLSAKSAGNSINIESLKNGLYIVKVQDNKGKVKISKFSKTN